LSVQLNKTDANDAHGLAQLVRSGWYREVQVKSMASHKLRAVLAARTRLVSTRTKLYNQIRGILKTFGVVLAPGKGSTFRRYVSEARTIGGHVALAIDALLAAWEVVTAQVKTLDRELARVARADDVCPRLMTAPGIGPVTAVAFKTTIDDPRRFRHAKDVGPYLGLTPRRYQSGDVDVSGRVSKCGDRLMRSLLYEAAGVLMSRTREETSLRTWGLSVARRSGYSKARDAQIPTR
jgi:transposase